MRAMSGPTPQPSSNKTQHYMPTRAAGCLVAEQRKGLKQMTMEIKCDTGGMMTDENGKWDRPMRRAGKSGRRGTNDDV